jgi:serine/threonine protein kinase
MRTAPAAADRFRHRLRAAARKPGHRPPHTLEGTLRYMAPEQTGRMNRRVDYRADFYALGATFYELLAGQAPFEARDEMELVHCHIARSPDWSQPALALLPARCWRSSSGCWKKTPSSATKACRACAPTSKPAAQGWPMRRRCSRRRRCGYPTTTAASWCRKRCTGARSRSPRCWRRSNAARKAAARCCWWPAIRASASRRWSTKCTSPSSPGAAVSWPVNSTSSSATCLMLR